MEARTDEHTRSKHPVTPLAGPYGHPFHPILVTIPIGVWVASAVFDIAALVSDDPEVFARGAVWLIGIGILGAVAAAVFGLMDLAAIKGGTVAQRTALTHMGINLAVVALFVVGFLVRLGAGYEEASVVGFAISLVALAALMVSGWLGGKLSYHYGVRVAAESTQAEGFRAAK